VNTFLIVEDKVEELSRFVTWTEPNMGPEGIVHVNDAPAGRRASVVI
jgi:hypothetical protein